MKLLKEGSKAPSFKLKDKDGKNYSLNDFDTDYKIIYFYPKDNTPGCTIEANMFTKDLDKFKKMNAIVIGISGGDEKTKTKFCEKYGIKVLLLSDTDFKVSKKYSVYGEKKFMGRKYMGISRVTYVLDKNNKIIKVYEKVTINSKAVGLPKGKLLSEPAEHSKEVLEFLKNE